MSTDNNFHAKLSPSARHRWAKCAGSVRLTANIPSKPSGQAAIDGTHTHSLLEYCIKKNCTAKSKIGEEALDHEGKFTVDMERAERVDFALNYIHSRQKELGESTVVIAEKRVFPDSIIGRAGCDGTVDVQLISPTVLEIIDYKDGVGVVDAVGNLQLEQYAIGAVADVQLTGVLVTNIRMTIIQPKLRMFGRTGIETWDVTLEELMQGADRLRAEAAATDDPNAPLVAGESQCRYCAASGTCVVQTTSALASAGIAFADLTAEGVADKSPDLMTSEQLAELLHVAPLLRQMIEACEAEAMRRLELGETVKGYKLVNGRGTRSWAVDDEVIAAKLKRFGVPKADMYTSSLVSVAQVGKVKWANKAGESCKLTPAQLEILNNEYVSKSTGKLTIAVESDPREAVVVAAKLFSPVVESLPSWLL